MVPATITNFKSEEIMAKVFLSSFLELWVIISVAKTINPVTRNNPCEMLFGIKVGHLL